MSGFLVDGASGQRVEVPRARGQRLAVDGARGSAAGGGCWSEGAAVGS